MPGTRYCANTSFLLRFEVVVLEQRGRQVRAARRFVLQPRGVDVKPSARSFSAMARIRRMRSCAEVRERGEQRRVGVVEPVAEDVQVLVLAVDRAELDGRDDPNVTRS